MIKDNWMQIAQEVAKDKIKIKQEKDKIRVFDPIRKSWIILTKEEKIRQLFIQLLIHYLNFSPAKISVEKSFKIQTETKRFDIVLFNEIFKPEILIELKNEEENIFLHAKTSQLINYQRVIGAKGLLITNGISTLGYQYKNEKWVTQKKVLDFF